jgi:nicotinate-nucleotide adenylyltransferase
MMKRVGFFGGTFDPPHLGHLALAKLAIEKAEQDKLFLCPAYSAPLRTEPALFSAVDRLRMIEEICKLDQKMDVWDEEIKLERSQFTFDTIVEFKKHFPDHQIFLLLGADQSSRLDQWYKPQDLSKLVHYLVFARNAEEMPASRLKNMVVTFMENDLIDISSTDIRDKLRNQVFPDKLLPIEVANYLKQKNLFPLN